MAEGSRSAKKASSPSWLASLMGAVFLISAGFMLGLVVGVVKEEPELVIDHLGGQSEEVRWSDQEAQAGIPDVAAGGPDRRLTHERDAVPLRPESDGAAETSIMSAEDAASRAVEIAPPTRVDVASDTNRVAGPTASRNRDSGFSVQVGAFSENELAEGIAADLRSKGYPVYVTPQARSRDGRWRVRVGPMATQIEAENIAQQLKTRERLPTWVLREEGS